MIIKERLNPCATLLYHWIRCHEGSSSMSELNLENFQVWTSEFMEESASIKEIDQALLRLMQLHLIFVGSEGLMTVSPEAQPMVKMEPLPKTLWKIWDWESDLTKAGLAIAATVLFTISGLIAFKASQNIHPSLTPSSPQALQK